MNYFYGVAIPKNTPQLTVVTTEIKLTKGTIDYISLFFPFGCAGLVGIQLWQYGYQLFPTNRDSYYLGDNVLIPFSTIVDISEEPFNLYVKGYNLDDLYNHTVYININMEKTVVNKALTKFIQALRIGV
jgi:hypothetical protein